ncbi:MAG: hypothetical protein H6745_32205 [Deltaproteobacteria bacterium]|nr:hypothetical protein [Deltaproteobacteria bacterium]
MKMLSSWLVPMVTVALLGAGACGKKEEPAPAPEKVEAPANPEKGTEAKANEEKAAEPGEEPVKAAEPGEEPAKAAEPGEEPAKAAEPGEEPAAAVDTAAPAADQFPAFGEAAKLKLLTDGTGEKAPLRWKPVAEASEKLAMVMDTDMAINVAGQAMPMKMTMKMDMDGKVTEVKEDGSAVVQMVVADASMEMPGVPAGGGDMFRDMLKGLTIEATMDPRGVTSNTSVKGGGDMAAKLAESMNQSLDQMSIPFPEEPVGIGAKWQALTSQETNGMKVRMVATYELVSLADGKGKVTMTIQQFADPQQMDMNGVKADLKSLKSAGAGTMEFELGKPMLMKADMTLKMDAALGVMGQAADMKVTAKVSMQPRE